MSEKSFWRWAPLLLLGVAILTYAVARWANSPANVPATPPLPPAVLRALGQRPHNEAPVVHNLAALTPAEAAALDGKRARFRVTLDSPPSDRLGCVCYGCAAPDDVERTLFLRDGEADRNVLEVEATFQVLHHSPAERGKTAFTGFTEYRLADAVRARP